MKTLKNFTLLITAIFITTASFGQKKLDANTFAYNTGNPADWPAELDAVIAAPKNHKILLENDKVRVLEVTLLPGEKEPLHHHQWPSTLYIISAGDFIDYDSEGNMILDSRKFPEQPTYPLTIFKNPEAPHQAENLSKTETIKLIRVEMKNGNTAQNIAAVDGLYKAFAAGDIPTVLAGMDPKIVWNEAESNSLADGNPYIGPEAVLNGVFKRLGEEHEYFKLADIQLHGMDNNQVLATLRYEAKVKKTGKTYNAQVAHLWTLKNGKVVTFQQFLDTEKVAEAMEK
ncbi:MULTISPECIES: nuclear transport factor 2 family protein [Aequorivita]|uniref:Nuclear transport factor 2 family protein n=2 Tax=Aequorivita TaxID=153265 RepID=A0AB35YSL4_9FLAO|nr:nuclear transport factor 2 family protein [Aequorivita sp. Ant34-E75]WGF92990.1 nuclear transport factor 2 family protein [Aequorivita sp. Ant34-E75]